MKLNRRNILAMFLCIALVINGSMCVQAEGETVSSGNVLSTVSSGDIQPTVIPGDAQPTVSSGDAQIMKELQVNASVQNISNVNGSVDPNGWEMVLEAWVAGTVAEQSGENEEIDETAVLKNELSTYFDYYCNCVEEIHTCVQTEIYTAQWDGSQFGEPVVVETDQLSVTRNGKIVEITGFDYDEHVVVDGDTDGSGQKLIVKFLLEPETGFWGGNNVPVSSAAVYCGDQVEGIFPAVSANVPLSVKVSTRDKTIYHGGEVTAAELLTGGASDSLFGVTAGYETIGTTNGMVTVNGDGTFVPAAEWMDDYASLSWNVYAGKTWSELSGDLSNAVVSRMEDGLYAYTVTAVPKEAARDGSTGAAIPEEGMTASDVAGVYVLVPKVTLRNTEIYAGYIPDDAYFNTYNMVSAEWVEMNAFTQEAAEGDENTATYPAADPATAPQLTFIYEPGNKTFSATSNVTVTVISTNDDKSNGIAVANQSVFYDTTGNEIDNAFTITVNYYDAPFVMPETGGMGTTVFRYSGMALMMAAALLVLKKRRSSAEKR